MCRKKTKHKRKIKMKKSAKDLYRKTYKDVQKVV